MCVYWKPKILFYCHWRTPLTVCVQSAMRQKCADFKTEITQVDNDGTSKQIHDRVTIALKAAPNTFVPFSCANHEKIQRSNICTFTQWSSFKGLDTASRTRYIHFYLCRSLICFKEAIEYCEHAGNLWYLQYVLTNKTLTPRYYCLPHINLNQNYKIIPEVFSIVLNPPLP